MLAVKPVVMRNFLTILCAGIILVACQARPPVSLVVEDENSNTNLRIRVLSDAAVTSNSPPPLDQQRLLADLLYAALQALADDRLLTPVDDNAHARFMRVLAYDANNEIALQGIQDIVLRYLQLSEQSMRRGLFEEAATMLDRARFVNADHADIEAVALALTEEMNSEDLFFELDGREFTRRSDQAQTQLADIARQAKQHSAFFLITAPNDDLARWMVSVMRQAVDGHRLRGNIELASRISIRLRMPSHAD